MDAMICACGTEDVSRHRSSERWIEHITLTTGHTRRSPRAEVSEAAIAALRPRLAASLPLGALVTIPAMPGYWMRASAAGRCLMVTAYREDDGEDIPLVTLGVAPHSRCGAKLWALLHRDPVRGLATAGQSCPPEPWCAAVLHPTLALDPEAARWLGDLERCIAWTWIAIREES